MSETWVEEHKTVKVGVKRLKVLRLIHAMEVVNVSCDLQLPAESVLHDPSERISGCSLGKWELGVPVSHTLRPDENEVNKRAGEHVTELKPDLTR